MEAGFSRMNDVTVIQASQVCLALLDCPAEALLTTNVSKGLCQYVLKKITDSKYRGIVIGYDHRHNSERFARLTAAAFLHEGVKVYLHRGIVHTPLSVSQIHIEVNRSKSCL